MRKLRRAHQKHARENRKFKRRMVSAGIAAAITLGTAAITNKALAADPPDQHQLPVAQDADADLLADAEEAALAYLDFNPDQNRNGIPDGVELAKLCAADINDLPWQNQAKPDETYKIGHYAFGLETCDICPTQVNMGFLEIVNPKHSLNVTCPFISLHYMEHGSFSYAGSVHKGRLDVPALLQALERRLPWDPNDHQLPVPKDADNDLLANNEESAIGYRPFDSDQNRNEIPDGVELAKRCASVVAELPEQYQAEPNQIYKILHALDGLERCYICGQWIHMGGWEIINPKLNLHYPDPNDPLDRRFLPDLALHYMGHGSFDCYGSVHKGRAEIDRLLRVLELRFPYDPNEHQLPLDYVVKPVGQLCRMPTTTTATCSLTPRNSLQTTTSTIPTRTKTSSLTALKLPNNVAEQSMNCLYMTLMAGTRHQNKYIKSAFSSVALSYAKYAASRSIWVTGRL